MWSLVQLIAVSFAASWSLDEMDVSWPLCGRITDSPPAGWVETDGCPADRMNDPAHSDFPLSSTYGPRRKASEGFRYDWHRGLDTPAPCGTPVYAIADGTVQVAGAHSSYSDGIVRLRHSNGPSCAGGCYHSEYFHLAETAVEVSDVVQRGDLIGWTGYSLIGNDMSQDRFAKCLAPHSGFDHLHMELREAPHDDVYSAWNLDAVHPLTYLPYEDSGTAASGLSVSVDRRGTWIADVTVHVEVPPEELDLVSVDLEVYRRRGSRNIVRIIDPRVAPDAYGWVLRPPWLDLHQWNRHWSHKNSTTYDWSGYFSNCPYAADHPASYAHAVHVDQQDPASIHAGEFNGLRIAPTSFNVASAAWFLDVTFQNLHVPLAADACFVAWATDASGNQRFVLDNCPLRARCAAGYADSRACP